LLVETREGATCGNYLGADRRGAVKIRRYAGGAHCRHCRRWWPGLRNRPALKWWMESSEFSLSVILLWYLSCRENFHGFWHSPTILPESQATSVSSPNGKMREETIDRRTVETISGA